MNFSLDFDGTYTADPQLWTAFIHTAHKIGHTVYCISYRRDHEMQKVYDTVGKLIGIAACISTNRTPKKTYTKSIGLNIDVWIDDTPEMLIDVDDVHTWLNNVFVG